MTEVTSDATSVAGPVSATGLAVRRHDDGRTWNAFVRATPDASFCHVWAWRSILRDLYGHECPYVAAVDERDETRGVLPLTWIRSPLLGHHLVSVPLVNYGGPVGTAAARRRLTRWALSEGRRFGADVVQLRTRRPPAAAAPVSRRKVTVVLPLPDSPELLWDGAFPSKLRSQIRRPRKAGMEVRFGADELDAFYRVFARNMRDLGTPVHPRALFQWIRDRFDDQVVFGAVYWNDRPVAGGCGFVWRDEFEMTWASALRECRRQAPNMLLYWGFMRRMIERGVGRFNFGRCTPGGGTHRFKRQWGGADEELHWVHWTRDGAGASEPDDGRLPRIGRRAWQRLPLAVANRVGPAVAKRLPWW